MLCWGLSISPLLPLDSRQAFPFSGAGISGKRWSPVVRYLPMLLLYTVRSVPSLISIAKLRSLLLVVTVFVVMSQSVCCICMLVLLSDAVSPNAAPVYSKTRAVFDQYREADVTPFGDHCFCCNVTVSVLYLYAGSDCSLGFSGWVSCGLYGSVVLRKYRFSSF